MITETTTTIEVPRTRLGLKVAAGAVGLLAAIALAIGLNDPVPLETEADPFGESSVVDSRRHDYALRHPGQSAVSPFVNSPDYALRHWDD
jgi:hypothetical protein